MHLISILLSFYFHSDTLPTVYGGNVKYVLIRDNENNTDLEKNSKNPHVLFLILALEICRSVKVPTKYTSKNTYLKQ